MAEVVIQPVLSDADTVMYLINYEDGWELLSADRRAPRVFAMSERGHASIESFLQCPELAFLFNRFSSNVVALKQRPDMDVTIDFQDNWNDYLLDRSLDWQLVSSEVLFEKDSIQDHLTQTRWGQGHPWNIRVPYKDENLITHCYTGCVPVAASQVLYYLHQTIGVPDKAYQDSSTNAFIPNGATGLILDPLDVQLDSTSYSNSTWDLMPMFYPSSNPINAYSGVSTLMLQMGLYLGAFYKEDATSANFYGVKDVFETHYSILSTFSNNVDFDIIAEQIFVENLPVILSIGRYDYDNTYHGHAVVVDACKEHYQIICKVYRRPKSYEFPNIGPEYEYKYETSQEMESRYVGINWGWNGSYMVSGGSTIWFNTDIISWDVGYVYTMLKQMIYGFYVEESPV